MKRPAVAALLIGALVIVAGAGRVAAAPGSNALTKGSVVPGSGSTTTTFVFSVVYSSLGGFPGTSVVALVANKSVPLTLISGSSTNGTYRGTSRLPAGSWQVIFQATAAGRNDPTLPGPTVVVMTPTPVPTATPRPKPPPTPPVPTPSATPAASNNSPQPSPSASAGTASVQPSRAEPSDTGLGSASASAAPLAGGDGRNGTSLEGDLGTFLAGGLAAIGLLAVVGFTAIWRDRRRERAAVRTRSSTAGAPPASPARGRRQSAWERDHAVQDEPIGTVEGEEDAPGNGLA